MKYILKEISHFDFFERLENLFSDIIQLLEKDESDEIVFRNEANQ